MKKNAYNISFNKNALYLIKELTPISNSIVISKDDDNIIVSQSNTSESLGYIVKMSKNNFNFNGDKIAFYDYREFFQLIDIFQNNDLKMYQDDRFIIMSDDNTKINYLLSEESTIERGPKSISLDNINASMTISNNMLIDIRKMLSAMFAQCNQATPVKVKVFVKNNNIKLTFYKDKFDNSFEKVFVNDVKSNSEFEFIISSETFIDVPRGSYKIDFAENEGITRLTLINDIADVQIFTGIMS